MTNDDAALAAKLREKAEFEATSDPDREAPLEITAAEMDETATLCRLAADAIERLSASEKATRDALLSDALGVGNTDDNITLARSRVDQVRRLKEERNRLCDWLHEAQKGSAPGDGHLAPEEDARASRGHEEREENARLKSVLRDISQEAHLLSVRAANGAISKADLQTMLAATPKPEASEKGGE